jgi:hypothetical protein
MVDAIEGLKTIEMADAIEGFRVELLFEHIDDTTTVLENIDSTIGITDQFVIL